MKSRSLKLKLEYKADSLMFIWDTALEFPGNQNLTSPGPEFCSPEITTEAEMCLETITETVVGVRLSLQSFG